MFGSLACLPFPSALLSIFVKIPNLLLKFRENASGGSQKVETPLPPPPSQTTPFSNNPLLKRPSQIGGFRLEDSDWIQIGGFRLERIQIGAFRLERIQIGGFRLEDSFISIYLTLRIPIIKNGVDT
jgi:hypothetical protein